MGEQPTKQRGPVARLIEKRAFRWTVAVSLAVVVVAASSFVFVVLGRNLKTRLPLISVGMTREQVEGILGPPVLSLPRGQTGSGDLLVWVDQLWQVDVVIGPDERVIRVGCMPSDSALRRAAKQLTWRDK